MPVVAEVPAGAAATPTMTQAPEIEQDDVPGPVTAGPDADCSTLEAIENATRAEPGSAVLTGGAGVSSSNTSAETSLAGASGWCAPPAQAGAVNASSTTTNPKRKRGFLNR